MMKKYDILLHPLHAPGAAGHFEMLLDGVPVPAEYKDGRIVYVPAEELTTGSHTVTLTVTRADGKSVARTWNFYVAKQQ